MRRSGGGPTVWLFFYVYVILNSFDDFIKGPFVDYFGSTALEKCENEMSVNLFYWVVYVV